MLPHAYTYYPRSNKTKGVAANFSVKGQLISKCLFGVFKSTKKPTVGVLVDLKTQKGHFEII